MYVDMCVSGFSHSHKYIFSKPISTHKEFHATALVATQDNFNIFLKCMVGYFNLDLPALNFRITFVDTD